MSALASSVRVARVVASDVKIAHSVFALPFAILAAFMAAAPGGGSTIDWRRFGGQIALIVVAMVLARTVAMLANRLLDREIDAENPRTRQRAIPSGRLAPGAARGVLAGCAGAFMMVCALFGVLYGNWWPVGLGVPVLGWISAYPLAKRYSSLCHLYLGSSLALSPLAAAVAVEPAALAHQPALWLLAAMVLFWVAGFDVIYALQDVDEDRRAGLFSLPSRVGPRSARGISLVLHVVAAGCLVAAARVDERLQMLFAIASAIVILLLAVEHATVARWGTTRIALAFFTLNGVISCVLGAAGSIDVVW